MPAVAGSTIAHAPKSNHPKKRNPTTRTPAPQNDHAASADVGLPVDPPSKGKRRAKEEAAARTPTPVSSTNSSATATPFNPKSILPPSKPKKTLSRLQEASSSGNKPAAFQCIDGAVRTSDQSEPVSDTPITMSRFDQYISSPDVAPQDTDEDQFTAFGIKAFPTRAIFNDICYDFVHPVRWCKNGSKCVRIHPLKKRAYLDFVLKEQRQFTRMRASTSADHGGRPDATAPHTISELPSDPRPPKSTATPEVSGSGTRHRTTKSLPICSSEDDVQNWDEISGLNRTPSSASSDDSDDGRGRRCPDTDPRAWECHTDASDWSDITMEDTSSAPAVSHHLPPKPVGASSTNATSNARPARSTPNGVRQSLPPKSVATFPAVQVQETPPEVIRHPRPANADICRKWLYARCSLGYQCRYVHDDLEYDEEPLPDLSISAGLEPWKAVVHDHIRVQYGSGFAIEDVTTGCESQYLLLGNLPSSVSDASIRKLLSPFGQIVDIKRPEVPASPLILKAEFANSAQAYKAFQALYETKAFGRKIDYRLATTGKPNASVVKDNVVRIDWDYAHRGVFMGYATQEAAQEAVERSRHILYDGEWQTAAALHLGLPAVGRYTVRFQYLPPNVTEEKMRVFGECQEMCFEGRPRYLTPLEENMQGIRRLFKRYQSTMTDLEFRPAPYKDGKMRAWAYFKTARDAEVAAEHLNGRKPDELGYNRMWARHIKTVSFTLPRHRFARMAKELRQLAAEIKERSPVNSLTIADKGATVNIRLSGMDMQVLSQHKKELERIINGKVVMMADGKVAWDNFFMGTRGTQFVADLESRFPAHTIDVHNLRRMIRILGDSEQSAYLFYEIRRKVEEMRQKKWHEIVLDGRLATALSTGPYEDLQKRLGADNLQLDFYHRVLRVRGDEEMLTKASDAVMALRARLPYDPAIKKTLHHECPVCLNEASVPVTLACKHTYCRACVKRYLLAAVHEKFFPLKCLGGGGKCGERLPLILARRLLDVDSFDALVQAAFTAHIQAHADEYHFCPTPDCAQIYRVTGPKDTRRDARVRGPGAFVQCPACMVRICPACDGGAHEGQSCAEADDGADAFQEWAAENDVRQCPKCRMGIEKAEGCNHMQCTLCGTHICWVCLKTFPRGGDVYEHMGSAHGGIWEGPVPEVEALVPAADPPPVNLNAWMYA